MRGRGGGVRGGGGGSKDMGSRISRTRVTHRQVIRPPSRIVMCVTVSFGGKKKKKFITLQLPATVLYPAKYHNLVILVWVHHITSNTCYLLCKIVIEKKKSLNIACAAACRAELLTLPLLLVSRMFILSLELLGL